MVARSLLVVNLSYSFPFSCLKGCRQRQATEGPCLAERTALPESQRGSWHSVADNTQDARPYTTLFLNSSSGGSITLCSSLWSREGLWETHGSPSFFFASLSSAAVNAKISVHKYLDANLSVAFSWRTHWLRGSEDCSKGNSLALPFSLT